jgi:hypothetical protein
VIEIVPGASSCQAFDPFGAVAASESATPAAGAFACRACSAFAGLADRQKLGRSGPIAAAVWQLARGSGDFSLSDRRLQGHHERVLQWLPVLMDLPGYQLSTAVEEPLHNLLRGPKRPAI